MNAKELMRPVITARTDQILADIESAFEDPTLRAIAVVDEKGRLTGFLTDEDLVDAVIPAYVRDDEILAGVLAEMEAADMLARVEQQRLGDLLKMCEREHESVKPDDTLLEVLSAFAESQASAVLVVQEGKPVGVITVDHVLRLIFRSKIK